MLKQFREEVNFTDGRIIVRGKLSTRGKKKRADYILYFKPNIPIGIIEVKDNNHEVSAGMQQGLEYADILNLPLYLPLTGTDLFFMTKQIFRILKLKLLLRIFHLQSCYGINT